MTGNENIETISYKVDPEDGKDGRENGGYERDESLIEDGIKESLIQVGEDERKESLIQDGEDGRKESNIQDGDDGRKESLTQDGEDGRKDSQIQDGHGGRKESLVQDGEDGGKDEMKTEASMDNLIVNACRKVLQIHNDILRTEEKIPRVSSEVDASRSEEPPIQEEILKTEENVKMPSLSNIRSFKRRREDSPDKIIKIEEKRDIQNLKTDEKMDVQNLKTDEKIDIQSLKTDEKIDIQNLKTQEKIDIQNLALLLDENKGAEQVKDDLKKSVEGVFVQ